MNPNERLAIWQQHLADATASLASVRDRFSGLGEAEIAKLRSNWKAMQKNAQGFVGYYEEKVSQAA